MNSTYLYIRKKSSLLYWLEYIYGLTVILLPFLYQYASPVAFLSLGDFLIVIETLMIILYDICRNRKIRIVRYSISIVAMLILLNIFIGFINSEYFDIFASMTIIMKMVLYTAAINVSYNHFHIDKVISFYKFMCLLFCVYLFLQVIYHSLTGGYLPICLNYEWLFSWESRTSDLSYYYNGVYWKFRPSSLFMEPGYYALYVMPCLYVLLIKENKIALSVLYTISLILSTSGAGVLLSIMAWGLFFLKDKRQVNNFRLNNRIFKRIIIMFSLAFAGICVVLINGIDMYQYFNSFGTRVYRGFVILQNFEFKNLLLGLGANNISSFMIHYGISTIYDEGNLNFATTLTKSFLEYGLVGFSILLYLTMRYLKSLKGKSFVFVSLSLLLIVYMIFEDMLFIYRMAFYFSILMYYMNYENKNKVWRKSLCKV